MSNPINNSNRNEFREEWWKDYKYLKTTEISEEIFEDMDLGDIILNNSHSC